MTIDEAIETLRELEGKYYREDYAQAVRLGIEALERIQNARAIGYSVPADKLPSETEVSPS